MKRKSKAEWKALVEKYQTSGEEQAKWCQENRIMQAALQYHIQRAEQAEECTEHSWVQVEQIPVVREAASSALTVEYGATRITAGVGYPVEALAELLFTLAWSC